MGRFLGSGVVATAKAFGIDRIPAVKGLGIPAHAGARSSKGWAVTYASSLRVLIHHGRRGYGRPSVSKGASGKISDVPDRDGCF